MKKADLYHLIRSLDERVAQLEARIQDLEEILLDDECTNIEAPSSNDDHNVN